MTPAAHIADRHEDRPQRKDAALCSRLDEAEQALRAIRSGKVDAITVETPGGLRVFTLEGSEHPYRVMVETMSEGAVTVTPAGVILYCNQSFAKLVGADLSLSQLVGENLLVSFPEEDAAKIARTIQSGAAANARFEARLLAPNGRRVAVNVGIHGIKGTTPSAVAIVITDLTFVNAARVQEIAARYARRLIEASLDPLAAIDAEGRFTDVNEATVQATGVSREQLVGSDFAGYFTDPDLARHGYRIAFENGVLRDYELSLRHRSGTTMDVLCNAAVYRDSEGKIAGIFAAARDITDKKKFELELVQEREHLEETVEARTKELRDANNALAGEIVTRQQAEETLRRHEQNLSILYAISRVAEQPLDLEGRLRGVMHIAADALGMDGGAVHLLEPDGETLTLRAWLGLSPAFQAALRKLKLGEGAAGVAALKQTPQVFDLSTFPTPRLLPLCRAAGAQTVIGVPLLLDDTVLGSLTLASKTPRPFLPDELNVLSVVSRQIGSFIQNAKLYDTARREISDRESAQAQLEAANKELEAFSYSVSHDLRAPLRAIDGFSQILLEDYGGKLDDEGKRLLGVVRDGTVKMSRLIDDILAFSRAGRTEMTKVSVEMEALVRSILADQLAPALAGRTIAIDVGKLPAAEGDRAMLERVWINLLDNAIKFTAPKADARIEIGAGSDEQETTYYARDNGVGFDMKYADKLFGVFQRLHGPEFHGTGIGLAIVKRIIGRHGGRVWAESKPGEGATFYFSLPAKEATHA